MSSSYWRGSPRKAVDILPFQPAPNVVQLVAQYRSQGNICENVFHYTSGAAPTELSMNNLIDAFHDVEAANFTSIRTSATALQRVTARDLTTEAGIIVDRAIVPIVQGVAAGVQEPNNVTAAVAIRTGLGGRSYRGRAYHIGMPASFVTGNALTDAGMASILDRYNHLLTLGVAPIFHLGVLSRHQHGVRLLECVFTQATALTLDQNLDSQRRRLNGRGT